MTGLPIGRSQSHKSRFVKIKGTSLRWDSNPHLTDFKSAASADWATEGCAYATGRCGQHMQITMRGVAEGNSSENALRQKEYFVEMRTTTKHTDKERNEPKGHTTVEI